MNTFLLHKNNIRVLNLIDTFFKKSSRLSHLKPEFLTYLLVADEIETKDKNETQMLINRDKGTNLVQKCHL